MLVKSSFFRSLWLLLFACSTYFVGQILFSMPGFYMLKKHSLHGEFSTITYPWMELLVNGGAVTGGIISSLVLWKFVNKRKIIELGLEMRGPYKRDFLFGLLLGAISITIMFLYLLFAGYIQVQNHFLAPNFTVYSLTYFILFVLVGFSEELFFRGYIMSTMNERNSPKWLVYIGSALIFSLFHSLNPHVQFIGLINIGLVGLLFAYMYEATKSLWMSIGYHITWNYFQGNIFGFSVSGTEPHGLYQVSLLREGELYTGGSFGLEGGILVTIMIIISAGLTSIYCSYRKKVPV